MCVQFCITLILEICPEIQRWLAGMGKIIELGRIFLNILYSAVQCHSLVFLHEP